MTPFLARHERFERVGSTNDVVRDWLADGHARGLPRRRRRADGRARSRGATWLAPPGAALLASLGFRPAWLEPADTWRLAAIASLAMADAAEDVAGLPAGTIRLKWPNDLVVETGGGASASWPACSARPTASARATRAPSSGSASTPTGPRADFPPDLAASMTSLREAGRRPSGRPGRLLDAFLERLEPRVEALRAGDFAGGLGGPPGDDRADRPTRDVRR